MTHRMVLATALATSLVGCETVESENVRTAGMYARYTALADGDGSTALSATLYLEDQGTNYIDLDGDDELIAWQGSAQRRMAESDFLNVVSYDADFAVEEMDTLFRIELRRSIDKSAPNSSVRLPSPFDLTTTPTGSVSRATDVVLDWSPSGFEDPMRWSASGSCIDAISGTVTGDPGTLTIASALFVKKTETDPNMPIPDSCLVTVTVDRTRQGSVDPAFEEGGSFEARQVRSTQFTSEP